VIIPALPDKANKDVQSGLMTDIFDFRYSVLHIAYFYQYAPCEASILHIVHMHHMQCGGAT